MLPSFEQAFCPTRKLRATPRYKCHYYIIGYLAGVGTIVHLLHSWVELLLCFALLVAFIAASDPYQFPMRRVHAKFHRSFSKSCKQCFLIVFLILNIVICLLLGYGCTGVYTLQKWCYCKLPDMGVRNLTHAFSAREISAFNHWDTSPAPVWDALSSRACLPILACKQRLWQSITLFSFGLPTNRKECFPLRF